MIKYFLSLPIIDMIILFFITITLIGLICYWVHNIYITDKKIKYLTSIGFKRSIVDLLLLGDYEEFYYIRENDRITEHRLNNISYEELKKRYK